MLDINFDTLQSDHLSAIHDAQSLESLEHLKLTLLGKKGLLTQALKTIGQQPKETRAELGQRINAIKASFLDAFEKRTNQLRDQAIHHRVKTETVDVTQPGNTAQTGHIHPITQITRAICDFFGQHGYSVKQGPEIETDFYNFKALNIPDDHPARDMHDTFYLDPNHLLRTHTSPVQIHVMETHELPIQIIVPGRVYRCDSDSSHSAMFHQIEGLLVSKTASFAELKSILTQFLKHMFGSDKCVRFRPSYFPFTEPSAEVDVAWTDKQPWLEILGCGMVHPNVLNAVNIDPSVYKGFAFGLGVERIAMLKYNIPSIKLFYENDQRFLNQF